MRRDNRDYCHKFPPLAEQIVNKQRVLVVVLRELVESRTDADWQRVAQEVWALTTNIKKLSSKLAAQN